MSRKVYNVMQNTIEQKATRYVNHPKITREEKLAEAGGTFEFYDGTNFEFYDTTDFEFAQ